MSTSPSPTARLPQRGAEGRRGTPRALRRSGAAVFPREDFWKLPRPRSARVPRQPPVSGGVRDTRRGAGEGAVPAAVVRGRRRGGGTPGVCLCLAWNPSVRRRLGAPPAGGKVGRGPCGGVSLPAWEVKALRG